MKKKLLNLILLGVFLASTVFATSVYAASSPEVEQCLMDFPDADFNAQLDCLDPILEKEKVKLNAAFNAKLASLGGDKKVTKALEKQQKEWIKRLSKSICPTPGRIQEAGYVEACKIEATIKRTAELSN
jgi:uncharacterized protein YecT (DUF1311 family)